MIVIYQSAETGLVTIERPSKGCWVDITNPTPGEVRNLVQDFNIPPTFATSPLDQSEIPRIEKADKALLMVVRISRFQSATASIPYETVPMGIILTEELVVTICRHEHELLHDLSHEHQHDLTTAKPTQFVLHLLWNIANNYILHLNEIDKIVENIEDRLQRSLENREVLELLRYQKSLVHFTTALRANQTMLERLHKSESLKMEPKDAELLEDVFIEYHQAIWMSEIARDILSQMMDAFASIISNNLNRVMKFMASLTLILVVPTIIASFYGMNVELPLAENPIAFLILVVVSILVAFIVGLILWRKGWL